MEQTSSSAYPNILVADYVKKARVASPQILMKAEEYLNVGYQKLLTFERPGGGFDWWGNGPPLVWLSAYGLQEFSDMAKVYPIDKGVIERTQKSVPQMKKAVEYIRQHIDDAKDNAYILALAANALASYDAKDDSTHEVLRRLEKLRKEVPEWKAVNFPVPGGQSLSYAHGDSVTVETTALAALAMLKSGQFTNSVNKALTYIVKSKDPNGTWGSTQATILSLKALVAGLSGSKQQGKATFQILVNGKKAGQGEVTEENSDVMQVFELRGEGSGVRGEGRNEVEIQVQGETNLMYQIVGRYFQTWKKLLVEKKPTLDVSVIYDRTSLSTADLLRAKATLKYQGEIPTYMVIVDLGIPPGFSADAGDFAEMAGKKQIQKFTMTSRQVTLYIGDVKPGDSLTFEYGLKPRYPIKAKTPATVAYEYYTPTSRATAAPAELTVEEKK
jgi:hypothetical protein